eukprot:SAG31_NODE_19_length_35031_cov_42.510707_15_plen_248_part_00
MAENAGASYNNKSPTAVMNPRILTSVLSDAVRMENMGETRLGDMLQDDSVILPGDEIGFHVSESGGPTQCGVQVHAFASWVCAWLRCTSGASLESFVHRLQAQAGITNAEGALQREAAQTIIRSQRQKLFTDIAAFRFRAEAALATKKTKKRAERKKAAAERRERAKWEAKKKAREETAADAEATIKAVLTDMLDMVVAMKTGQSLSSPDDRAGGDGAGKGERRGSDKSTASPSRVHHTHCTAQSTM